MSVFFVSMPDEEDRFVEAHGYEVDGDLVFRDAEGVEVGRVVEFGDMRGASVLKAVDGDDDEVEADDFGLDDE